MTFKLPDHAQQQRGGNLFRVYTWQQEMFDGRFETFESVVQEDAVLMIVVDKGEVIVAKEFQPHFTEPKVWLLGGRLPRDKEPLAHAKVELLEEAGMISDSIELLGIHTMNGNMKRNRYHYIVKQPKIVAKQSLDQGGETLELMRISFDEFIDYVLHHGVGGLRLKCAIQEMIIDGRIGEFRDRLFS